MTKISSKPNQKLRTPSEVKRSVTEVTNELVASSLDVLHDEELQETNEGNNLGKSSLGDGIRSEDSGQTVGVGVEGVTGVVDVSTQVNTSTSDDVSKEGKLTDTSVLDLNITEAVKLFFVSVSNKAKGIEESVRRRRLE